MSILSQQKQSVNTDFPNLRPSLDLRFALAKKLDPRITFTRGSSGTYFGPDGIMRTAGVNEPRFDHDPITGQSLGLLVEESRTNNIIVSEDFSNANWNKTEINVTSNATLSPDNTNTADLIIPTTTRSNHIIVYFALYDTAHYSLFCKPFGYNSVAIGDGSNTWQVKFDLSNGTSTVMFGGVTANIIPYPNGWYRISGSVKPGTNNQFRIFPLDTFSRNPYNNWAGNGAYGIYVWGAQVETGSFPTSYIPTSGSTVTRSADNADMTGTNFSSWYNSSEGTFIASTRQPEFYGQDIIGLGSGTGSIYNGVNGSVEWWNGSRLLASSNTASWSRGVKVAASYNSTTRYLCLNGGPIASNPTTLPNGGLMRIGRVFNGTEGGNGTISRITYYPIQLTNQQLINLTS